MLQNTGRVCGGHYRDSYAFRSSPFLCAADIIMILLKLVCLLSVGCSPRAAARHVWYDRFEREPPLVNNTWELLCAYNHDPALCLRYSASCDLELGQISNATSSEIAELREPHPGSGVDRAWRLSIFGFIVGALPQIIKVYSMRGVPLTQVVVSIFTLSFVITEVLRLVAGIAGAHDLRPGPFVSRTKEILMCIQYLFSGCVAVHAHCVYIVLFLYPILIEGVPVSKEGLLIIRLVGVHSINVSLALTVTVIGHIPWMTRTRPSPSAKNRPGWLHLKFLRMRSNFAARASRQLALRLPTPSFKFTLIFGVLTVIHILWLTHVFPNFPPPDLADPNEHTPYYDMITVVVGMPAFLPIPYFLHRLLFLGPISRYPRYLFGLNGSDREFCAGMFIMANIMSCVLAYSTFWSEGMNTTYRPIWADYLG
jgi:hypothetical protein